MLKVAFVGTSCTGKTTLLEEFRRRFDDTASYAPEVAREYFTANNIPHRYTVAVQGEIADIIKLREDALHSIGSNLIFCDRSVLDAAVYVRAAGDLQGSAMLIERHRAWLPTYSRLFLLDPTDIPYERDEIRREDRDFRDHVHQVYLDVLAEHELNAAPLSGSVETRVNTVDAYLRRADVS